MQKMVKKEKVKLFEKSGRKLIYMPSSGWGYTMAASCNVGLRLRADRIKKFDGPTTQYDKANNKI